MSQIQRIETRYFRVPLRDCLVDALHGIHTHFELITATVTMDDGTEGTGYTYTGGFGGAAIAKMAEADLTPLLIGQDIQSPEQMNDFMNQRIHYVARGGIASFAISALDIAFWDAKLKREGLPLCRAFGREPQPVRTYYGGIDLAFTQTQLLESLEAQLKRGHTAVKIKLGKPGDQEDLDRIRAVRQLIGDDALFLVDVNMVWDVEKAIRMARRMEEFRIHWLEEPTNPDDYEGYARIAQATTIPIAMGENLHTIYEHELALKLGRISYPIPDCSNICGITGFVKVAKLADTYHLPVSSHGMQELHVNLLAGLKNPGLLEFHSFPIWEYTLDPLTVEHGYISPNLIPGVGVRFDWEKLKPYQVN